MNFILVSVFKNDVEKCSCACSGTSLRFNLGSVFIICLAVGSVTLYTREMS